MSVFTDLLKLLGLIGPDGATVVDTIGQPVIDVDVEVFDSAGTLLHTTQTDANGHFAFPASLSLPASYELVIDPALLAVRLRLAAPPGPLQIFTVRRAVTLTNTIGIAGTNAPIDLRRVQEHLRFAGRLTDAAVAAEPINATSIAALAPADIPRLMTALYAHLRAGGAGAPMQIAPGSWELAVLNVIPDVPPILGAAHALTAWVGDAPGAAGPGPRPRNLPAEVRFVQDRLLQLGFLSRTDHFAERADPAAPAPIPVAGLARTVAAIQSFNKSVVGSLQQAIFPGTASERLLRDPYFWGQLPLKLVDPVGRGVNRSRDVRALQDRLNELGLLSDSNHAAERVTPPPQGDPDQAVRAAALSQTILSIRALHALLFGPPAPPISTLMVQHSGLSRLNQPPQVAIFEVGDEQPPAPRPAATNRRNHPRHVRAVQDRLLLLDYLSDVEWALEAADPIAAQAIVATAMPLTLAAIRTVQAELGIVVPGLPPGTGGELLLPAHRPAPISLNGAVGQGLPNRSDDVRAIQDRLHALRFLSAADHAAERVTPSTAAATGPLPKTFAAISAMRRRIFELPPASADPWSAQPIVAPGSDALAFLNDPLFFGRVQIALDHSVGALAYNHLADVRTLQARLNEVGLLTAANLAAETPATGRVERMSDPELPRTIEAIVKLCRGLIESPPDDRIEAVHPALYALNRPYKRLRLHLDPTDSVGTGGGNAQADVAKVQRRLRDLRVLAAADFESEAPLVVNPVNFASLPRTQDAINEWRDRSQTAGAGHPPIGPFDPALRRLEWPLLPVAISLPLGNNVGAGPAGATRNRRADILAVQERLHELGVLATAPYLADRRVAAALPTIAGVQMGATVAAIFSFQRTAAGNPQRPDGIVGVGGHTARILEDPTFATPTSTNPDCALADAGPTRPVQLHTDPARNRELLAVIAAIEAHEGGVSSGEVPALMRNGSSVPASFGKAQVVGSTAVSALQTSLATGAFYGLDAAVLTQLNQLGTRVSNQFDRIFALVPAPGLAEAALVAAIAADRNGAATGPAFRAQTGLGEEVRARIFRTAQLSRHVASFIAGQSGPNRVGAALANLADFDTNGARQANRRALGLTLADVRPFVAEVRDNEHRNGFINRALFQHVHGMALRAAMTDDSGFKIGRLVIRDNFVHVLGRPGGAALSVDDRARITARIHNSGRGGLAGFIASPVTAVNDYVTDVMRHWVHP